MILWIVGLSGAGKTTLGREVYAQWKARDAATVLVDGDEIRAIFGADRGGQAFTLSGRRQNADRIVEICNWLDRQGINVVCCVLCIFPDVLAENRHRFTRYFEVFLDAPLESVMARDAKGIYAGAKQGTVGDVVGIDIPFPRPLASDLVIANGESPFDPVRIAAEVLDRAGIGADVGARKSAPQR